MSEERAGDGAGTGSWRFQAATAPRRALPSLRSRAAVAAALVVALALTAGATAMFYFLQRSLLNSLREDQVVRLVQASDWVRGDDDLEQVKDHLERNTPQGQSVQVVDEYDNVVAASATWAYETPITGLRARWDGDRDQEPAGPLKLTDAARPFIVGIEGAERDGQTYTVISGSWFTGQRESLTRVLHLLLIGLPLLVLMVGAGSWWLVGRALRPVETIRSRVSGIGAEHLAERVPVPQTRDEISHLAITMNEMLDRLQASQDAQRQFVSDASHELRSPLASLAAGIDVARSDPRGDAWREMSGLMAVEVDRMSSLVGNLLLLAKADGKGLKVPFDDVDLDDVIAAEVRLVRAAGSMPVAASIRPVRVQGDELQLSQVARNLIDNAVRHARTGIGVRLDVVEGVGVLIVEDDGPGIPAEDRERVFERFVRLDFSRDRGSGGSGLGLAIVAEVVRAHGGRVEVREAPGGGCQMIVQFPLAPDEAHTSDEVDDDTVVARPVELPVQSSSSR